MWLVGGGGGKIQIIVSSFRLRKQNYTKTFFVCWGWGQSTIVFHHFDSENKVTPKKFLYVGGRGKVQFFFYHLGTENIFSSFFFCSLPLPPGNYKFVKDARKKWQAF